MSWECTLSYCEPRAAEYSRYLLSTYWSRLLTRSRSHSLMEDGGENSYKFAQRKFVIPMSFTTDSALRLLLLHRDTDIARHWSKKVSDPSYWSQLFIRLPWSESLLLFHSCSGRHMIALIGSRISQLALHLFTRHLRMRWSSQSVSLDDHLTNILFEVRICHRHSHVTLLLRPLLEF